MPFAQVSSGGCIEPNAQKGSTRNQAKSEGFSGTALSAEKNHGASCA
jgi:hypothetical protein